MRPCLLTLCLALGVLLVAAVPASAKVRWCGTYHAAGRVHTKDLGCRKGRRIANFYEHHGRCPHGWRLRQFGHVDSPGGTWDECKRNGRWVRWTEYGE
ncbi:MAG TPA: hypothetical protein VGF25_22130 [Thermoleophilaceae bacterium]|jgi:hypothetical protein